MQGRAQEAREAFEKTEGESQIFGRALAYHAEDLRVEADNALASLIERYGKVRPSDVARVYACRGDVDHAFDWLGRAYELRDARLAQPVWDPLLKNLYRDPRWPQLLNKVGIAR